MMLGIDVSWNNGVVDWKAIAKAGVQFAIIRSSYGKNSKDDTFIQNVYGAHEAGLICGAYHYSYALTPDEAVREAYNCREAIDASGALLELQIYFDLEDADGYKGRYGFDFSRQNCTNICKAFLDNIGLNAGIYASYSWLKDYIDWQSLGCPVWNAAWLPGWNPDPLNNLHKNPLPSYMWQYTDKLIINGKQFDGNLLYN